MMRLLRWTTLAGVVGLLSMAAVVRADEKRISERELPRAVLKAARAKFPKAKIAEAIKEVDGDETIYELSLKLGDRTVDVAMEADGTILEVEKELTFDELPEAVKHTLAARYPNAKVAKVETLAKRNGLVCYEIAVTTEVVLDAKGKLVGPDGARKQSRARKSNEDEDEEHEARAKAKKRQKDEEEDEDEDEKSEHKAKAKARKGEHE